MTSYRNSDVLGQASSPEFDPALYMGLGLASA